MWSDILTIKLASRFRLAKEHNKRIRLLQVSSGIVESSHSFIVNLTKSSQLLNRNPLSTTQKLPGFLC